MNSNCDWCGGPISEVGRLKTIRDWITKDIHNGEKIVLPFGEKRKKARVRHVCEKCERLFDPHSGTNISITNGGDIINNNGEVVG